MLLIPRYDGPPLITIAGPTDDQREPLLRQRRRLASLLDGLSRDDWSTPSRCEGWTVHDVIAHLIGTNRFWSASIDAGLAGEPLRVLTAFDPVATPAAMVEPMRALDPGDLLAQLVESNEAIAVSIEHLDASGWQTLAESPPGHVDLRVLAHHALWDSWVHERDVAIPLGIMPVEEADEVMSCLRYVAALGPALAVQRGGDRQGSVVIEATDPEVRVVVDVLDAVHVHDGSAAGGAVSISGRAVDLVEMLSLRAPFTCALADDDRWLFAGLAEAFDAELELA